MYLDFRSRPLFTNEEMKEHLYNISTRGYSIFPNFLESSECGQLKQNMEVALLKFKPRDNIERSILDKYQIHDLMASDINYAKLLEDPRIDQLLTPFLGEAWIMYAATSSSIPPGGENYASRLHIDSARFHKDYIFNMGVIWALDEYTPETGALKILPGSQNYEQPPSLDYFEKNSSQVCCKSGAMIVFNARTYHRTCKNITDQWNHSMTLNGCRSFMKQRMDWVRFIPDNIIKQLNPLALRLIGYDTRLPTSLDEFFLPENERLYKANQG